MAFPCQLLQAHVFLKIKLFCCQPPLHRDGTLKTGWFGLWPTKKTNNVFTEHKHRHNQHLSLPEWTGQANTELFVYYSIGPSPKVIKSRNTGSKTNSTIGVGQVSDQTLRDTQACLVFSSVRLHDIRLTGSLLPSDPGRRGSFSGSGMSFAGGRFPTKRKRENRVESAEQLGV